MTTIIYKNGGDYIGEYVNKPLESWKGFGRELGQQFMYKGYRYWGSQKDCVIVYDNVEWDLAERARRKGNGFLGIKVYYL